MTLARKDVSVYVGAVIPFYEKWTHRHEFLTRGQRRGETVEEYFQAKWDLLMDDDSYGDMIAAYPAYWSGLRRLELVILMDGWVLGRIWPGQIVDRDPQIEAWAADTAPDVGALQKLLSTLDDQRAVWSQVRAFRWGGSRGQRGEGDVSRDPPRVTEAEGGDDLEPAASPDQKFGAVGTMATSDPPGAPLHLGEEAQGSPGSRGIASAAPENWAAVPGMPSGAAQGGLEPKGCGDLPGEPQPRQGEGQPTAQERKATAPPRVAAEPDGGRERADPPLVEEPPG